MSDNEKDDSNLPDGISELLDSTDESTEEPAKEENSQGKVIGVINKALYNTKDLIDEVQEGDEALSKLKIQNLDFILDIPLRVSIELGRTTAMVKDVLQLGQGSVLELDKMAGEPLAVLVNGKLIARGEVVVVNEKFGIRITDIISPIERIETLK